MYRQPLQPWENRLNVQVPSQEISYKKPVALFKHRLQENQKQRSNSLCSLRQQQRFTRSCDSLPTYIAEQQFSSIAQPQTQIQRCNEPLTFPDPLLFEPATPPLPTLDPAAVPDLPCVSAETVRIFYLLLLFFFPPPSLSDAIPQPRSA